MEKATTQPTIDDLPRELRICLYKIFSWEDFQNSFLLNATLKTNGKHTVETIRDLVSVGMFKLDPKSDRAREIVDLGQNQYIEMKNTITQILESETPKSKDELIEFTNRLKTI